jgi:hypothetical protein
VIALNRLNRIVALDPAQRIAVVEPGVINLDVSRAAAPHGLYYAPDPSSQLICTIGGNVAFQLRRCALPEIWHDRQPRAGHQGCAARWRSGAIGRRQPGAASGPT